MTASQPTSDPSVAIGPMPLVSVVVPTYNRVDRLRSVLQAFADQTVGVDTFELIVISDGSTDGTDEYLTGNELPLRVTVLTQINSGPGAARNRGLEVSRAEIVLFIDDDVIPASTLIAEHLAAQSELSDTVVIGPMLTPDDHPMSPWVDWEQRMLYKQYDAMRTGVYSATARQFYTGNASIPRRHLIACNGFDETFRRAEDVELAFRLDDAGVKFHFHPEARGFHYAERGFESWCDIAHTYGRNDVIFARQDGREWLPPFMVWAFSKHHLVVKVLTRTSIRWPRVGRAVVSSLQRLVRFEASRPRQIASLPALSVIYSVRYHQGVADELAGSLDSATAFRELLRSKTVPCAERT
jgi:glycosyltransferase involved in cell wall biosynthesis